MTHAPRHWIVKQEPSAYSWDDFVRDGRTAWTGVRNFQARNNLRLMKNGDPVLFYHSVTGKAIVGVASVVREAYPDPTATDGEWVCVDLAPLHALERAVTLDELKADSRLQEIGLVRQSRLSVIPVTAEEYQGILRLSAAR